jgi:hypothetical protein
LSFAGALFGWNTSVIWKGLTWMWNGWAMSAVLLYSVHSSSVFRVIC